jgi:type II secretory pathway pseudopilin PulG
MTRRTPRPQQLGMTLIEAVIAALILGLSVTAIVGMITRVEQANGQAAFSTKSLDALATIASQIRDAQCDYSAADDVVVSLATLPVATVDPGLLVGAGWQTAPVPNSVIDYVGDRVELMPPIQIAYQVVDGTGADVAGIPAPVAIDAEIRIRHIQQGVDEADWPERIFPVAKVCTVRLQAVNQRARGEYLAP